MSIIYEYDPVAAEHADDNANRLDTSALYDGQFKKAEAIVAQSGTQGIRLYFSANDSSGDAIADLYTQKEDGTKVFGFNLVAAIMFLFKLKELNSVPGMVTRYDEDAKGMIETEGEVFPDLCDKDIGCVFQKDITGKGRDGFRMNLVNVCDAKTHLTMTEIKEGKKVAEKIKRILRNLKDKDSRKAKSEEPEYDSGIASGGGF